LSVLWVRYVWNRIGSSGHCCEQGNVPRDSIKCGEFFTFKHAPTASQEVVCARDVSTSMLKLLMETAVQRKGKTEEHSSKTALPFCVE